MACEQHELGRSRFVFELTGRLEDDEGRTVDQIMGLEHAIDCGFRHEVTFLVRERHGQLASGSSPSVSAQVFPSTLLQVSWDVTQ